MAEDGAEVPRELTESIKDVLGRKVRIALKKKVRLEVKGDKLENKVLVLTACRAFLLAARIPSKLELTFSYLDIQGVTCSKPAQMAVETEKYSLSLRMAAPEDVSEVLAHVGSCLRRIFPGLSPVKIMKRVSMEPSERLASLQAEWDSQPAAEQGPCGGFSQMYACVCDWLGFPYREEVQWDVDTIYLTQDTRELNLQDFSHLDHRDLIPIIAALEYNQWFSKLSSKDLRLSSDVCEQILRVVSRSSRLEELVLENAGLRIEFAQKLASALAHNPSSGLHTINLAGNALEDRGVASLSVQFAKLPKGLKHLNLSKTSLSPKGVNCLSQSLSANPQTATALTHLDLSGNSLRGDDLSPMYSFLAQPNALTHLDLSSTECALDMVCAALLRGCLQYLAVLNLSRTVFSHRKGKEVPPSFRQFFSSSLALTHINLSGTKLAPEPLKALLLSLNSNRNLKAVSLDLSSCELRSGGAQVLEGCIAEIHNITSLDISDNGLESDLSTLIVWLSRNRSIQHLALGKNFTNMKPKNLTPVLDSLVQMIQDEESPLQSLSLADSKLKTEVTIIINALGSNTSLTKVDISGNAMGDMGAKMLAKALQINTKLRTVIWDKNNISAQGFQDIAVAMEKNYTLRFMPIPMYDAAQALKTNPEKTEEALQKIENYLLRNHETRKYLQEQAYRLQQGIVTSTTQQMMDRMCVKVQDHLNSLRNCGGDAVQEDVRSAERLMRDAKNSKTLLPNLYHVGSASWAGASGLLSSPVQETLESMAGEVTRVVDEQLKALLESMVDAAESLCPHVMKKAHVRQDLILAGSEKLSVPRAFVKNVLLEQSGVDILNKISEVKLTVASFLSDRIVDELLDALSHCHHRLSDHFSRRGRALPASEASDAKPADEKPARPPVLAVEELTELERLEDLDTCLMTPKSKRKTIHSRMLRPVSRAFEMEFDLDKALEEVPIHVEDPPLPSPPRPAEKRSSGLIPELPSEEGRKLEHFTKLRPRRNKRQRPTQAAVSAATMVPQDGERNGLMGRVDEGVDEFFTKKVTRRRSSARGPEAPDLGDGSDEKKKRESRRSGFLHLIKPRTRAERPPTVLMAEEPSSPRGAGRGPVDAPRREARPAEHDGSSERTEEVQTPEPPEHGEDAGRPEPGDGRGSPPGGRRYGVQVMGSGLLAEMKAKQGRRAAGAHQKLGNDAASQDPPSPATSTSTEQPDGGGAGPKLPPALPGSPERNARAEPRVDAGHRGRSASSARPALQTPKPSPAARPALPQKPRAPSRAEDVSGSPSGLGSPRAALLPPVLRKVPADKEREGQGSPQPSPSPSPSPRTFSQEVWRRSWGPQPQEFQDQKPWSPSRDGRQGSKASDSGEDAEKEFIFV
ncbi:F-actin-uncapping protein LRRC16A isoform X2 [Pipistrellus kuhlii]|uniref:Capping protein regulator and myosin 1 linker 1 n=1 Tax=Pipistrellus kuhlii TaxID=59472 RepID=A0A7J7TVK4_PIPKU|nr:F-actin-uncapping protein LRRC16A isoform X2 [Pipistrellus kuhlii]KAF6304630.1 capping protein regulator and myosin 1 linker 1 [Pipistrellus kuhlii]